MYKAFFKRVLDILLSGIAIVVLAVPMLIVSVIIKADSPGPVFFVQNRVGLHKKEFRIIKFRSMPMSAPHDMPTHELVHTRIELTRWQRFIRRTSIDELPQIFNIFVGQMSIVGPRPVVWSEIELVAERDRYGANDVKPGLTGWAQINGRDELEISEKAKLDGVYSDVLNMGHGKGFIMDCRCFFGTVRVVLRHEGVVECGEFDDNELHICEKCKEKIQK